MQMSDYTKYIVKVIRVFSVDKIIETTTEITLVWIWKKRFSSESCSVYARQHSTTIFFVSEMDFSDPLLLLEITIIDLWRYWKVKKYIFLQMFGFWTDVGQGFVYSLQ